MLHRGQVCLPEFTCKKSGGPILSVDHVDPDQRDKTDGGLCANELSFLASLPDGLTLAAVLLRLQSETTVTIGAHRIRPTNAYGRSLC